MLTISRSDIRFDDIEDFGEASFIKFPIKKYLQLLPAKDPITQQPCSVYDQINDPQVALINALNNPKYRFVVAAYSRRLGKTYIANIIGQLVSLVPGCNILIMSPNYNLSSISFELQRSFIQHFELEIERDNLKDRIIALGNGSTVRMGSVGQVDSCVGRSYDLIIFDEAALSTDGEAAFNVALRPTLDKPGAKAVFISTPRGRKNWFTRFHERGFSEEFPEWVSLHADYRENKRMLQSDVDEARNSMSKAEFEQEYMASFTMFEGAVFQDFDHETMVFEENPPLTDCEMFAGLDPGFRDPTAMVVIAYDFREDKYYIVDEYQEVESTTAKHAEAMQRLIDRYGIDMIFIDSAAAQFGADLAFTYDISTTKAKKDILPGIAYVQTLIQQDKLRVNSSCQKTIDALSSYRWDMSDNLTKEKPVHDEYSHLVDAVRYALYSYTV